MAEKYAVTYANVAKDIQKAEHSLSEMINDLTGNEFDMQGLTELQKLMKSN